ncbi:MAG: hypothetical protein ACTSWP_12560 [Candidatus Freyarchaeota archaeon]
MNEEQRTLIKHLSPKHPLNLRTLRTGEERRRVEVDRLPPEWQYFFFREVTREKKGGRRRKRRKRKAGGQIRGKP